MTNMITNGNILPDISLHYGDGFDILFKKQICQQSTYVQDNIYVSETCTTMTVAKMDSFIIKA